MGYPRGGSCHRIRHHPAEEGCAHAALHPGSEHHHTLLCIMGFGGGTDYIVHVQYLSMSGPSPPSEPLHFRTLKEADQQVSKSKDEVTMEEVGQTQTQLRAGELIIIVVVLIMWAGVIALFCRQYDIIKDNEPNNNKDKAKNSSECSTPEHPTGGLLRSKFPKNNRKPSVNIIEV
ncbi:hypothetical protein AGOR_G00102850 [Albula goreensis]|uniref:Fibronectin type III domain-containing protein n=1 Tax=Albula goreensis TaxID=1534307 RepID=A0A8T3DD03_9TELE|nr:hypothetical protein AGOR_G00102850 [Albula goreensis]